MGCGTSSSSLASTSTDLKQQECISSPTPRQRHNGVPSNESKLGVEERRMELPSPMRTATSTVQRSDDFKAPALPVMQTISGGSFEASDSSLATLALNLQAQSLVTAVRKNPLHSAGGGAALANISSCARKPNFMQPEIPRVVEGSEVAGLEFPTAQSNTLPEVQHLGYECGPWLGATGWASHGSSFGEGCFSINSRGQVSELTANGALLHSVAHNAASSSCFSSLQPVVATASSDRPSRSSSRPTTPRERRADPLFEIAPQHLASQVGSVAESFHEPPSSSSLRAVYGGGAFDLLSDSHCTTATHDGCRPILGMDVRSSSTVVQPRRGRSAGMLTSVGGGQLLRTSSSSIGSSITTAVDMHFVARQDSQAPTLRDFSSCKDVLWSSCGSSSKNDNDTTCGVQPEVTSGPQTFVMGLLRFKKTDSHPWS